MMRNFLQKIPTIVWVVLSYILLAVIFTWPIAKHFSTHLLGAPEDNQQFYWNLWWWQKALAAGQNPFYTNWLFFPKGTSLLLHTISPLNAVLAQFFSLFFNLAASFNLLIFFSLVVSGVSMYYLALDVVKDKRAAWVAGLIFTLAPRHISHIYHHLNIIGIQFIPLVILCLRRVWQGVRPYYFGMWTAVWLILTFYTDFYNALYIGLWCVLFVAWKMLRERMDYFKKIKATAWVVLITLAFCLPLIVPMVREKNSGAYPEWGWDLYGADLTSFVLPPPYHWLVGEYVSPYYQKIGLNDWEATHYVGISVLILAVFGWWRHKRELLFWVVTGTGFAVLSFGPVLRVWGHGIGNYWPYYWFVQQVPIIQMAKTAGRFSIFLVLSLSLAAAFGIRELVAKWQWRWGVKGVVVGVWAIAMVIVVEFLPRPATVTAVIAPSPYYEMATDGDLGAVVDVPAGDWLANERYMLLQTIHGKPIVTGAVSRAHINVTDFIRDLNYTPEFFKEHGLKYLVLHRMYMNQKDWTFWNERAKSAGFTVSFQDERMTVYRAY